MLEILHREKDGIEVIDLNGSLTFGQEDLDFRNDLERLPAAGKTGLLLNLSGLSQLDATGIATILFIDGNVRKAGGRLAVFNTNPSHIALLLEARLETSLDVFATEREALQSFFPNQNIQPFDVLKFVHSAKLRGLTTAASRRGPSA